MPAVAREAETTQSSYVMTQHTIAAMTIAQAIIMAKVKQVTTMVVAAAIADTAEATAEAVDMAAADIMTMIAPDLTITAVISIPMVTAQMIRSGSASPA